MADQPKQTQYDYSMLPTSRFYNTGFNKNLGYIYVVVLILVIVVSLTDYALTNIAQLSYPSWILNVFIGVAVAVAGCVFIWNNGVRDYFYNRYRNKFLVANSLTPIDDNILQALIPESLKIEGSYDIKVEGYRYNFGDIPAILMEYTYTTGAGKSSETINCFVAILQFTGEDYPHLFLDGKTNGANSTYKNQQKVQLEGNFNEYFDLYMPEGSSAGSLTILSPDVMQSLIDIARPFDVEINHDSVALIGLGLAYTLDNLRDTSKAVSVLSSEFKQLNYSWQPVYDNKSLPFELKRQPAWRKMALIFLVVACIYAIVSPIIQILLAKISG